MPGPEHSFLRIHPICPRGYDEAGSISGYSGLGNVRRFQDEIDLAQIDGVRWETVEAPALIFMALTNCQKTRSG
jgi:hypothetical protein